MSRVFISTDGGRTSRSLPFEEVIQGEKRYWYYQVTAGNIMVAVDVYGNSSNPMLDKQFKTVVISKEGIVEFESQGESKEDLMSLPLQTLTK